jgi:hypothetical protein
MRAGVGETPGVDDSILPAAEVDHIVEREGSRVAATEP